MRRRDFLTGTLKALAAVPLVGPLMVRRSGTRYMGPASPPRNLNPSKTSVRGRLRATRFIFDEVSDGDTFDLPRYIQNVAEMRCVTEANMSRWPGTLGLGGGAAGSLRVTFPIPDRKKVQVILWVNYLTT